MGSSFYLKMAINNIKRNKRIYMPYILASTIMVAVFFIVTVFIYTDGLTNIPASENLKVVLMMGNIVIAIFSVIFMFYVNSFLIKRRTKEFGLYGILGLEQRHVAKVIFLENLITMGISIILGIIISLVFGKLLFMGLLKLLHTSKGSVFSIPAISFIMTGALFGGIFILTTIYNLFKVRTANPIDLLKSEDMGEKKMRFVIPMTVVGLGVLGWAYYTALNLKNAMDGVTYFFPLAIAVIVSTYLLFYAGTNFILRILKKNKKFYYKSDNFVAISGLFHRMKQNATGLASICILSIMLLVTISLTTSLYLGTDEAVKYNNPHDMLIEYEKDFDLNHKKEIDKDIENIAKRHNIKITSNFINLADSDNAKFKDNTLSKVKIDSFKDFDDLLKYNKVVYLMTPTEYKRATGTETNINKGELVIASGGENNHFKILNIGSKKYTIKQHINDDVFIDAKNTKDIYDLIIVANEGDDYDYIKKTLFPDNVAQYYNVINYEVIGGSDDYETRLDFSNEVFKRLEREESVTYKMSIDSNREGIYTMFGGLMFIGVFFSLVFLSATILIIYFKQVSEGFDDKENFEILQKVGMDDKEVKKTINKQVMIVFFLPLLMTIIHIIFASNLIIKFINAFMLLNNTLTITCIAVSAAIFTLVYIIVYKMTAKVYYGLVKW